MPAEPAASTVPPAKSTSEVSVRSRTDGLPIVQFVSVLQPSVVREMYEPPPPPGVTVHWRLGLPGSPATRRTVVNPLPALAGFSVADDASASALNQTLPKLRPMK